MMQSFLHCYTLYQSSNTYPVSHLRIRESSKALAQVKSSLSRTLEDALAVILYTIIYHSSLILLFLRKFCARVVKIYDVEFCFDVLPFEQHQQNASHGMI